jgi:hypothetical protein
LISPEKRAEKTADELLKTLDPKVAKSIDKKEVTKVLESREFDKIIDRIGHSRALAELYIRPEKWQNLVDRYRNNPSFRKDLNKIKKEGLVTCPDAKTENCSLTASGKKVASKAQEDGQLRDLSIFDDLKSQKEQ